MKEAVWSRARAIDPLVRSCIGARNLARVLRRGPIFAAAIAVAGCAAAPERPPVTKDPCLRTSAPAFPDTEAECVSPTEPAGGAPSCVPAYARGRELARNESLHVAVYEACLPENRTVAQAPVLVDPRRVIIERSGERPASASELDVIVGRLSLDISTRDPALVTEPFVIRCRDDRFSADEPCLGLNLRAQRPDLPAVMTALAKWLPMDPICVAMKVEFGAPEGCPIEKPPQLLAQ